MRRRHRIVACLVGLIGALTISASAFGAGPWLSIRQQGVSAASVHIACTDNGDGTQSCEAEVLSAFRGKVKISGSPTLHGEQVCYEKLTATVDAATGDMIEGHGAFGCAFDAGTLKVRSLASIVLRSTRVDLATVSCNAAGCVTGPGGQVTVKGTWTSAGRALRSHSRFRIDDGMCLAVLATQARARQASFRGTAGGARITSDVALVGSGIFRFRTTCLEAPPA
jgi:hypothetical protein